MQILTKNLVLVSKSNPASIWQSVWVAYIRKNKKGTSESAEVGVVRFSPQPAKEVTMDITEANHSLFKMFGNEFVNGILNKWLFRQQNVLSVQAGDETRLNQMRPVLEETGFELIGGKWRKYKPDPHYTELFLAIGGMCGLLFSRFFAMPIAVLAIGFALGFMIGFPMEKKYKEEINEQRIDY